VYHLIFWQELYASGARKAISFGLGPSGCSPLFRANNPGECISAANSLAIALNGGLKQLVTGLHEAIPDFNIVYANRYDISTAIIADDKDFGNNIHPDFSAAEHSSIM
jgi:phospholipase/lecithinase/hemolysin